MKARSTQLAVLMIAAVVMASNAASFSFTGDCVGILREGKSGRPLGTAFMAGRRGHIVTCAHVVASGTNFVFAACSLKTPQQAVQLLYALPRHDLAVLKRVVPSDETPLDYGDMKRIRPGDPVFYLGYDAMTQNVVKVEKAPVSALGSVMNVGAVVDFLEFEGRGLPGFSGDRFSIKTGRSLPS